MYQFLKKTLLAFLELLKNEMPTIIRKNHNLVMSENIFQRDIHGRVQRVGSGIKSGLLDYLLAVQVASLISALRIRRAQAQECGMSTRSLSNHKVSQPRRKSL